MLTFGSLFAGIGGIDLGLERAGMRCAWQVEIDDYATRVLTKHWPDVPKFRDVRKCGAHNLARVDLIAGGFPCQPHSTAGKRKGADDNRNLWPEFARIIRKLRPEWVLAENVPGLLSSDNGRFFGSILRDLAESGYDAEWQSIPAAALGAPHIRERVFVLAHANSTGQGWIQPLQGIGSNSPQFGDDGPQGTMADAYSDEQHGRRGTLQVGWFGDQETLAAARERSGVEWSAEPGMGRILNGVPNRLDRLRGLGNAVVPQVAEFIGRYIMEATCPTPQLSSS